MEGFSDANPEFVWVIQYELKEAGIFDIKKFAPAIIFKTPKIKKKSQYDIWVEDPSLCDPQYPHDSARTRAELWFEAQNLPRFEKAASAFILKNTKGDTYLICDRFLAGNVKRYEEGGDEYDLIELEKLNELQKRYNLKGMIGMIPYRKTERVGTATVNKYGFNVTSVLGEDLVGKIREEMMLYYGYAEEYHMTNTQYMRFRTLARAAKEAVKPASYMNPQRPEEKPTVTYDDIARSVILDKALDEEDPFPLL